MLRTETKELEVPKPGEEGFPEDPEVRRRKQGTPQGWQTGVPEAGVPEWGFAECGSGS